MPLTGQLLGQIPQRLHSPAQRRDRIPALIPALLALLDEVGAAEVHQRIAARTSWRLLERGHPRVALRVEISEPSEARGVVDVMMDAEDFRQVWQEIREGRWVGITSSARLHPHADGSQAEIDEVFAACIPLDCTPAPALSEMAHTER